MEKWVNSIAVVTGANHGNGHATLMKLAKNGINIVGLDVSIENIEKVKNVHAFKCDLTKSEEVEKVFEKITNKIGQVQILVNNAGIFRDCGILDCTKSTSELEQVIDLNLTAVVRCSRLAYKSMLEKPQNLGYIININSIHGHSIAELDNGVQLGIYPASKYGITAATEVMRRELVNKGNRKIKITSLSPGLVKTNILKAARISKEVEDSIFVNNPFIHPEDIANTIEYLLSTPEHVNISEITVRPTGGNV